MITAKQLEDAWGAEFRKGQSSSIAWKVAADLANKVSAVASVPRIIHASFWRTYFNWADGLEKVLRSEQVDPAGIAKRLDEEYAAACTRLADLLKCPVDTYRSDQCVDLAKDSAIPPKK